METHARSVVKGISWRAVGTLDTTILVFLFTGELVLAAGVGATELITKVFLYWLHERAWQRVRWGRIIPSVSSP